MNYLIRHLALLLFSVTSICGFIPTLAQDSSRCSAQVTVVDDRGAAVPAGNRVTLLFSLTDIRQQETDGQTLKFLFNDIPCGEALAVVGTAGESSVQQLVLEALAREQFMLKQDSPAIVSLTVSIMTPVVVRAVDVTGAPALVGRITLLPEGQRTFDIHSYRQVSLSPNGLATILLKPGRYQLLARFSEGQNILKMTADGAELPTPAILVVGKQPMEFEIVVSSANRLAGIVTDEEGEPIDSYELTVESIDSSQVRRYRLSGEEGRFVVTTPEFPVELSVTDYNGDWIFEPSVISVVDKDHATGLHFIGFPFEGRRLRGVVLAGDPAKPAGRARINSTLHCPEESGVSVAKSSEKLADEDGEFEVPCPAGCQVSLTINEFPPGKHLTLRWNSSPGDCDTKQSFALQEGNVLTGVVTDTLGHPVPELIVGTQFHAEVKGKTDEGGRYRITNLGTGRNIIKVTSPGTNEPDDWLLLPDAYGERPAAQFDDIGKVVELDLSVTKGGTVCLDLQDENGNQVDGEFMEFFFSDSEHSARAMNLPTRKMEKGSDPFCSDALIPSDYQLHLGLPHGSYMPVWWPGTSDRDEAAVVSVMADDRLELGVMTVQSAGPVRVQIKDGYFVRKRRPLLEFREVPDEKADKDEEVKWERVDQDAIRFVEERKNRTDDDQVSYGAMHYSPYPTGRYDVRICEKEDCKEGKVWCSTEPVVVEKKKGGAVDLVPGDNSDCKPVEQKQE